MSDAESNPVTGYDADMRTKKAEAKAAKSKLRRELLTGSASRQTKLEAVAAIEDLRDELVEHRGERALDTAWDDWEPHPDTLAKHLGEVVEVAEPLPRRGSPTKDATVPKVATLPAQLIINVGDVLDQIAKELGHSSSVPDPTPEEEATMADLRGLVKARDQTEALENLPGGGDEGDGDEQGGDEQ